MVRAGANPDPRKEASSQQKLEHQFIFDTRLPGNFFLCRLACTVCLVSLHVFVFGARLSSCTWLPEAHGTSNCSTKLSQRPLYSILCHLLPLFPRNLADLSFNVQHRTWKRCACRFPPHEVGMPCSTRHQARSRQCIMLETTLSPGQRVQEGSRFVVERSDVVAEQHDPCLAHGPDVPLCPGLPVLSWVFE